jgi:ribosomal subunit interface protein
MQLSVSGKHLDVGESLRTHVSSALGAAVDRYFGRAIEGKVVFARARHLYRADISVHIARGMVVQSHGEAPDPYAAFDAAADRLDTRLKRHRGRLESRHKDKGGPALDQIAFEPAQHYVFAGEGDIVEDKDHGQPAIVAEIPAEIATLTVGEAVMRLDLGDLPVLMFRNRAHGTFNVVYRRSDGTIGWIDPGASGVQAPAESQTASRR